MGTSPKSLSVIVPALNEEKNIRAACEGIVALAEQYLEDYEILVIDDASEDQTREVVRELAAKNPRILLFRNSENRGLGYNYWAGVSKARCQYTMMLPGDNEVISESLHDIFQRIGTSDIVICYSSNPAIRSRIRQFISILFTAALNTLFGLKIRYYNGPCVVRTDLSRRFWGMTNSFAYMAVLLVHLLKLGHTYQELPFRLQKRKYGRTNAFRFKNIIAVVKDVICLFWKIQIRNQLDVKQTWNYDNVLEIKEIRETPK